MDAFDHPFFSYLLGTPHCFQSNKLQQEKAIDSGRVRNRKTNNKPLLP